MLIGITGGISSGKNLVAGFFKECGAYIIDADEISRDIIKPGMPAYNDIICEFGSGILNPDGIIDRKKLGDIVFNNNDLLKKLNQITHPRIIKEGKKRIKGIQSKKHDAVIVVNAALLIESGHYKEMDKVIVVYIDEETQIKRLMQRDGLTGRNAMMRIACQMPLKEKVKFADFVIDNTQDIEKTRAEAVRIFERITQNSMFKTDI